MRNFKFISPQIKIGAVIPRSSEYIKCCTGPIKYRDFEAVHQDVTRLNKATDTDKPEDGSFMTAASPGVVALFQVNPHI